MIDDRKSLFYRQACASSKCPWDKKGKVSVDGLVEMDFEFSPEDVGSIYRYWKGRY